MNSFVRRIGGVGLCVVSMLMVDMAQGEGTNYYLKVNDSYSVCPSMSDPSAWVTGEDGTGTSPAVFRPEDTFFLSGKRMVIATENAVFQGGKLNIGYPSAANLLQYNGPATFSNGIHFANGYWSNQGGTMNVYGDVYVDCARSAQYPFYLWSAYADAVTTFHGALIGNEDNVFVFGSHNNCAKNSTYLFVGDCSEFKGLAILRVSNATTKFRTRTGFSSLPGTVQVLEGAALLTGAAPSGTNTIGTLELHKNAIIELHGTSIVVGPGNVTHSHALLAVSNSLTLTPPIRITASREAVPPDGLPHTFDVLTAPENMELNLVDFVFEEAPDAVQYATLGIRQDGSRQTLTVTFEATAELIVTATSSVLNKNTTDTAMNDANAWSDGQVPCAGIHYVVRRRDGNGMRLRFPNENSYTFPGASLTIGNNCYLGVLSIYNVQLGNLRLQDGSHLYAGFSKYPSLHGTIQVDPGTARIGCCAQSIKFYTAFTGTGELYFAGPDGGTSAPYGEFLLRANSPDFKGRMRVAYGQASGASYLQNREVLYASDERHFGAKLDAFDPKALVLHNYGWLRTDTGIVNPSFTLSSDYNRGVFVDGPNGGVISPVNADHVVTLTTRLTLNGKLWKDGAGTFAMGNSLKFGADGIDTPTDGENNLFEVVAGTVKVIAADALNGIRMTLNEGTALQLRFESDDADLLRYGIRNVKTDVPFTLASGTKLPLSLDISETDRANLKVKTSTIGLVTVSSNAAASVRGMLEGFPCPIRGMTCIPVEVTDPETGDVTFAIRISPSGMAVILQ